MNAAGVFSSPTVGVSATRVRDTVVGFGEVRMQNKLGRNLVAANVGGGRAKLAISALAVLQLGVNSLPQPSNTDRFTRRSSATSLFALTDCRARLVRVGHAGATSAGRQGALTRGLCLAIGYESLSRQYTRGGIVQVMLREGLVGEGIQGRLAVAHSPGREAITKKADIA